MLKSHIHKYVSLSGFLCCSLYVRHRIDANMRIFDCCQLNGHHMGISFLLYRHFLNLPRINHALFVVHLIPQKRDGQLINVQTKAV